MIHWNIALLLTAAAGLIGFAVGRPLGEARGVDYGLRRGRAEGYREGRDRRWAADVRIWAGDEEEGGLYS